MSHVNWPVFFQHLFHQVLMYRYLSINQLFTIFCKFVRKKLEMDAVHLADVCSQRTIMMSENYV